MSAKEIKFSQDALSQISEGIDLFAKTVGVTLGPKGRHVIYDKSFATPTVTKDGVTVAKEIELEDKFQDLGCRLIREVASKSSDTTGDGTTTATILAQFIVKEGIKLVVAGHDPNMIRAGMRRAVDLVVKDLREKTKQVKDPKDIYQVALISSNGDEEIGGMIAEALDKIGQDGVITVEESQSIDSSLKIIEGIKIDQGYLSSDFLKDDVKVELEKPYILVTDQKISSLHTMANVLNEVAETDRPLLIVADDVVKEALQTLILNHRKEILVSCAIKGPGVGDKKRDVISDIAIMTGATFATKDLGIALPNLTISDLGQADKVVITRKDTLIIGAKGDMDQIEQRMHEIKGQIRSAWSEFDIERFQDRLGRLVGGVGVIYVGAATEIELKEKKARVEDALNATQAAVDSGVLPGGGVALFRSGSMLDTKLCLEGEEPGFNIIRKVLEIPLRKIAENAGKDGSEVVMELMKNDDYFWGFNAQTGQFEHLDTVLDPANVVIEALRNAVSIGGLLLTTEAAIVKSEE